MVDTFPTRTFGFKTKEVDIERQTLKGGTSLSGEQDVVSSDGGGRVFADFGDGDTVDVSATLAWRAFTGMAEEGVGLFVVPFCDPRHQPVRTEVTTFGDGATFDDGAVFSGLVGSATASGSAALRAVTLNIVNGLPVPLVGGEWFTIVHPTKGERAYKVLRAPSQSQIEFRPPLRQAIAAGTVMDFANPRCLMNVEGRPGTATSYARHSTPAVRFVEAP